jgi:putative ABC transport system permease protein
LDTLLSDLRHTLRLIRQQPGFAGSIIAALALGIGANTAIFSVVNTVLLKPLPYPDPERLVLFLTTQPQGSFPGASPAKFNVWREQTDAFDDVSAYRSSVVNLTGGNDPEQISAGQVTAPFFRLFGAPVAAGRTFSADEDRPNGGQVVVLANGFWRRRFGGDPAIVGRTISLNGAPYLVIGVLGPFDTEAIQPPTGPFDIWLPFQIDPASTMQGHFFLAAGRIKAGLTPAAANARLQSAANDFRERYPGSMGPDGGFSSQAMQEVLVRNVRTSLWVLVGAVGFVLLIACANVANLLLVRATARQREIAVRAAMGAGRRRIVTQLLTESVALALIGGAIGLVLGIVGIRALLAVNPGNIPRVVGAGESVALDWRVMLFTLGISIATGVLFGLFPALHASRTDLNTTLKESSNRSGGSFRQNKARAVLVVAEISLALVLLVGAALFIRTFAALRAVNPGFDASHVLTLRMSLTGDRFSKTEAVAQVIREGADRLKALAGIDAAAASVSVPLQGGFGLGFIIEGRPLNGPGHGGGSFTPISDGYFSVFKIPVLRGRAFTDRDAGGAPGVVIINDAMARRYWPKGNPLGERLTIGKGLGPGLEDPPREIVGVVGDVRDGGLNREPQPIMYVPFAQLPDQHAANLLEITTLAWLVRTRGEPQLMSESIASELRTASGGLPVARVRAMNDIITQSTARSDFNMFLLSVFAGLALLLAAIGIYGLMAYSVQQRTQEIGIRMALGADSHRVRNMVVFQGMAIAVIGVALGLASSFGLSQTIASFLYGVTARDPLVFVAAPTVLALVALLGVWLPACRAARVNPVVALRAE